MFRPISILIIACLYIAGYMEFENPDSNGLWYWITIFLVVVPIVVFLLSPFLRNKKYGVEVLTYSILVSWCIALFEFAWAEHVRVIVGNQILIDELLIIFPVIISLAILWGLTSPIKRRLAWVSYRIRLDVLLLLVPILGLWGVYETTLLFNDGDYVETGGFIATVILVVFTPLYIPFILSAREMKDESLLQQVQDIGVRAGISRSNILVWNTHGRLMNAFAIGIIFQRRTILLTDKLIENLTNNELLAVVGHEFAHHKYRHLTFLGLSLLCVLVWSESLFEFMGLAHRFWFMQVSQFIAMSFVFALISRKFERQADAYSVIDQSNAAGSQIVTTQASSNMSSALRTLSVSHNISPDRYDPLHGSIQERQEYLEGLIGCPIDSIPLNRTVKRIKIGIVLLLVLGLVL